MNDFVAFNRFGAISFYDRRHGLIFFGRKYVLLVDLAESMELVDDLIARWRRHPAAGLSSAFG